MTDTATTEPTRALLRGVDAALRRPVLLDPTAVDVVRSARAFHAAAADAGGGAPKPARRGNVAIVGIEGPLAQRAWSCMGMFGGDGYDAIQARVQTALDDPGVRAIVLRIDSPGGEVAGCFEAVRAIRAAASAAGKPLVAYADEFAASAAYALACACDSVVVPETGVVGSVGVLMLVGDRVAANEAEGLNLRVMRSGPMKAVPHPDEPLTDAGVAKVQAMVDAMARVFAAEVAGARGMPAEAVLALDGATFLSADAVAKGLADRVGNLDAAVAYARELATTTKSRRSSAAAATHTKDTKMSEHIAKALGLSADASDADVLSKIHDLQSAKATGEQTIDRLSRELGEAKAEAQAAAKRAEKVEREREIEAAKAEGKWTAALDAFLGSLSAEQLKAWRASAPRVVPAGEVKPPADEKGADAALPPSIATLAAKGWAGMTVDEKHAVTMHDAKLAARLRAAAA